MLARLRSAGVFGVEGYEVQVEVDVASGLPGFTLVGLPGATVRESRDRVRSAIRNCGFTFPRTRITINLAPADMRKAGAAFDLPIAVGILAAAGQVETRHLDSRLLVGELSLDGRAQPIRGVLPVALAARRAGVAGLMLPRDNAREACVVDGLAVVPVGTLRDAVASMEDPAACATPVRFEQHTGRARPGVERDGAEDLRDVRGQSLARRALEIAAAGGHSLLLVGPPGGGKTMMARRLASVLPPLTRTEALETTAIHSVAGLVSANGGLLRVPPFRAPHHTVSTPALIGGGTIPRPGELSLAHNGVLFLDEVPEFARAVLEALRQPLEEGCVRVARMARTAVFPARIMLVAAMNPCPCGFKGDASHPCRCTPLQVERYRRRLSGPLLDRVDLTVEVPRVSLEALGGSAVGEPSAAVRARVVDARERQLGRSDGAALNGRLDAAGMAHCRLGGRAASLLDVAARRLGLSARAYHRVIKVARTVADLSGAEGIERSHVAEALQFRVWA